jgi:hypothetical protein
VKTTAGRKGVENQPRRELSQEYQRRHTQIDFQKLLTSAKSETGAAYPSLIALLNSRQRKIEIDFRIRKEGTWKDMFSLIVNRSNPSEVERIAKEQISKGFRIINKDLRMVPLEECFEVVTSDGTNTILFIPENDIVINETLRDSVAVIYRRRLKRKAKNIS